MHRLLGQLIPARGRRTLPTYAGNQLHCLHISGRNTTGTCLPTDPNDSPNPIPLDWSVEPGFGIATAVVDARSAGTGIQPALLG